MERIDNYYDLTRCSEAFFDNSDFERKYYKMLAGDSEFNYCIEDSNVYF